MTTKPKISVVVCTYNRAQLLEKCIRSLLAQKLSRELFEIIVVNNASTDETQDIIEKFQHEAGFRSIFEPVSGLSKARNTGWRSAKSKYIGYLDDDAFADQQWLESALFCFENTFPKPDALTGPIQLNSEVTLPKWITDELKVPLGYLNWGKKCFQINFDNHKIVGANCFFSKMVLQRLDGFNEDLGRKKKLLLSGEEVQLQKEIEMTGGSVWYHPDVSVKHFVPEERTKPTWYYNRYYWGGVSDYIMSRTPISSKDTEKNDSSSKPKVGLNILVRQKKKQCVRLMTNLSHSIGVFSSETKMIQGRIYMSYACGYLYSSLSRYWKKI